MKIRFSYTRHQAIILATCVAIFALGQFHRASGGVFTPILMDGFAVSAATIGTLVSAMFFATILVQLPFGVALDRFGPRLVLTGCIAVIAAGTALFALNLSYETALMSRILIGVGLASMGAATHVIIARNFDGADFGYISGLVVTLGGIGGLLGTYPLALALTNLSWLSVFFGVAVVTALLALLVFAAVKPGTENTKQNDGPETDDGYFALLKDREFLKILALGVVTFAPITTITGLWGGPYLQDAANLSPENTGAVLLLLFAATIAAGYTFGVMDKRFKSRLTLTLTAVGISSSSLLLLAALDRPGAGIAICLLMTMVFFQQFYIPLGAHMRNTIPDNQLGRASTLLSLVSVAAIPGMQIGFGAILDYAKANGFGVEDQYRMAFGVMGLCILLGGAIYATSTNANNPDK